MILFLFLTVVSRAGKQQIKMLLQRFAMLWRVYVVPEFLWVTVSCINFVLMSNIQWTQQLTSRGLIDKQKREPIFIYEVFWFMYSPYSKLPDSSIIFESCSDFSESNPLHQPSPFPLITPAMHWEFPQWCKRSPTVQQDCKSKQNIHKSFCEGE